MRRRAQRGRRAEQTAHGWLRARGFAPVAKNFRCRYGELDLVMLDGDVLVVVEVRSRADARFVAPQLSVDPRKQVKIIRSAECFLNRHPQFAHLPVRFDVVAITGSDGEQLEHLPNAFEPDDQYDIA